MDINMVEYKDYIISREEGIETGLFFRSPIQRVVYDAYFENVKEQNAWDYASDIKNPIRRFFEILIGNKKIVDNIDSWRNDPDWGGFSANKLCSPIYFKRAYCSLTAYAQDPNLNIQAIHSRGYESQYEKCAGACVVEKTIIKTKSKKIIKFKMYREYLYTYINKVCDLIDSQKLVQKKV